MSEERKIKVRNFIDPAQLKIDSSMNPANLNASFMDQASLLVHYGTLEAQASRQVDDVKLLLENTEAAVDRKIRDEAATTGTKTTEPQLEKLVARHPKVIAMKKALNEAKQIEKIAKIAVEAFRHRKDMLVQVGANERKEMEGEIVTRIRENNQVRDLNNTAAVLRMRKNAETAQQAD